MQYSLLSYEIYKFSLKKKKEKIQFFLMDGAKMLLLNKLLIYNSNSFTFWHQDQRSLKYIIKYWLCDLKY